MACSCIISSWGFRIIPVIKAEYLAKQQKDADWLPVGEAAQITLKHTAEWELQAKGHTQQAGGLEPEIPES